MNKKYDIKEKWAQDAKVSEKEYNNMYSESINKNEDFWQEQGKRIDWIKQYSKIKDIKGIVFVIKV